MGIEIPITTKQRTSEKRQSKRYRYRGDAKVRQLESDFSLPGRVLDLSARGCLLQMPNLSDFAVDTLVDMCVNTGWVSFRALGSVRHVNLIHWRIGISFVKLTRRGESELLELIADLEKAEQAGRSGVLEISIARHSGPPPLQLDEPDQLDAPDK
ncbi:MAG: PilZ domain-containing protein [Acidobacteriaceae bacterium]